MDIFNYSSALLYRMRPFGMISVAAFYCKRMNNLNYKYTLSIFSDVNYIFC